MTSLNWKLFWGVAPVYTLTFIVLTVLMGQSLSSAVISGLISGLLFGVIFAPITARMHRRGIRRRGFDTTSENLGVTHQRILHLSLPFETAFEQCREALEEFSRITIQQENHATGTIAAKNRMTWDSFGERIVLKLQSEANSTTRVVVSSRPILPTTVVDYGKNLENVERIRSYLATYET